MVLCGTALGASWQVLIKIFSYDTHYSIQALHMGSPRPNRTWVTNPWHTHHKWHGQPLCVAWGRLGREQVVQQQIGQGTQGKEWKPEQLIRMEKGIRAALRENTGLNMWRSWHEKLAPTEIGAQYSSKKHARASAVGLLSWLWPFCMPFLNEVTPRYFGYGSFFTETLVLWHLI